MNWMVQVERVDQSWTNKTIRHVQSELLVDSRLETRWSGFARTPLQIDGHIAFGLALQAGIAQRRRPFLLGTVIFQTAILDRLMVALAYVVEYDARTFIARHGKAYTIGTTVFRHPGTAARIAEVAEITQIVFSGCDCLRVGAASSSKTCA